MRRGGRWRMGPAGSGLWVVEVMVLDFGCLPTALAFACFWSVGVVFCLVAYGVGLSLHS
jgi:hypothetical protein